MAYSFLIFDFGSNEEGAQQARHRIEGWKQGFRLDKKMQLKFEREEAEERPAEAPVPAKATKAGAKAKAMPATKSKSGQDSSSKASTDTAESAKIRLIVRLDFSDHEKLSHQRWLERIPAEDPFKSANPKIIRPGEPEFEATSNVFDSLD